MAFLGQEYRVEDLPESGSYDLIPAGWYQAQINSADLKLTKSGDGQYLSIRFDILGPSHQGRVTWGNVNLKNASAQAEEIGRRQLGEILRSIGKSVIRDSDELIGGQLQIKVGIQHDKNGQYEDRNDIKGYKALDGTTFVEAGGPAPAAASNSGFPAKGVAAKAPAAVGAGAAKGPTPPWMRK